MSETLTVNSAVTLAEAHRELDAMWAKHRYFQIELKQAAGRRTLSQNAALHLFCGWLAEELNAAGYDMRAVLKQDVDIPWTTAAVKEYLWRPIQRALTDKTSTTEITTVEPTLIHETLCRHLAAKLGVVCPEWPNRDRRAA
jgi:hypothetical protein